jgi:hypothetical protein
MHTPTHTDDDGDDEDDDEDDDGCWGIMMKRARGMFLNTNAVLHEHVPNGASQCAIQEALNTMLCSALTYSVWSTPVTSVDSGWDWMMVLLMVTLTVIHEEDGVAKGHDNGMCVWVRVRVYDDDDDNDDDDDDDDDHHDHGDDDDDDEEADDDDVDDDNDDDIANDICLAWNATQLPLRLGAVFAAEKRNFHRGQGATSAAGKYRAFTTRMDRKEVAHGRTEEYRCAIIRTLS